MTAAIARIAALTLMYLVACGDPAPRAQDPPVMDPSQDPPDMIPSGPPVTSASVAVPTGFAVAPSAAWGYCTAHWAAPVEAVDAFEIQASVNGWVFVGSEQPVVPGTATQAEIDFTIVTHELEDLTLHIRAIRGHLASEFTALAHCAMPIAPQDYVVPVVRSTGVEVRSTMRSLVATTLEVERATLDAAGAPGAWSAIAAVPIDPSPFGGSYFDATAVVGNAYAYRVVASKGSDRSASVQTTTLTLAALLPGVTVQLPQASISATDGNGHYAFAGIVNNFFGPLRITWRHANDWVTTDIPQAALFDRGIKLDAAGLPHAVYGKPTASNTNLIVHGWSDGTQWREETIAERRLGANSLTPPLRFDLDAAGQPVMMWSLGDDGTRFEVASKVGGAWQISSLDSVLPFSLAGYAYSVFADQSGVPHALAAAVGESLFHLQGDHGVWTRETLPLRYFDVWFGGYDPVMGAGHDPDHLIVCLEKPSADFFSNQAACIRKSPAGWGALEPLGVLPSIGGIDAGWLALSADGAHVAAIYRGDGTHVFRSDGGEPWTESIITPLPFLTPAFTGSKLVVLSAFPDTPFSTTLVDDRMEAAP